MKNPLELYGFKKDFISRNEDPLNHGLLVPNPFSIPFDEVVYSALDGMLVATKILAVVYNFIYDGDRYNAGYIVETAQPDGTTKKYIYSDYHKFFSCAERYIDFLKASSDKEKKRCALSFSDVFEKIHLCELVRDNVPHYDSVRESYNISHGLWRWTDKYNALFFQPKLGMIWADKDGLHYEDPEGYFSNTDKYFASKEECVDANLPKVIEFGVPVAPTEPKEYTVEIQVKVKANSYEEALELSKKIETNVK